MTTSSPSVTMRRKAQVDRMNRLLADPNLTPELRAEGERIKRNLQGLLSKPKPVSNSSPQASPPSQRPVSSKSSPSGSA